MTTNRFEAKSEFAIDINELFLSRSELKKAKDEVKQCIKIINSRIQKKYIPQRLIRGSLICMSLALLADLIATAVEFSPLREQYLAAGNPVILYENFEDKETCGTWSRWTTAPIKPEFFFPGRCKANLDLLQNVAPCYELMKDLCRVLKKLGPEPVVMLILGVLLPLFVCILELLLLRTGIPSIFSPELLGLNVCSNLKPNEKEFVNAIAIKHGIELHREMSLEEQSKEFTLKYNLICNATKRYESSLAFTMAAHNRLGQDSVVHHHFFRAFHKTTSNALVMEIFDYAGLSGDIEVSKPSRNAFFTASAQKNRETALGKFFTALNKKDENGDFIYEKKKILNSIMEYAGIARSSYKL